MNDILKKGSLLGKLAAVLMLISPFLNYEVLTINGKVESARNLAGQKDLYLILVLALLGFVFAYMDKYVGLIVVGAVGLVLVFLKNQLHAKDVNQMNAMISYYESELDIHASMHYSIGFYLLLISSALLIIAGFICMKKR